MGREPADLARGASLGLLDLFWSGKPMTGYHAWVFPFVALFFHLPAVFFGRVGRGASRRASSLGS